MAKVLIYIGVFLLAVGAILAYFPNAFSWFGRLPGDLRVSGRNSELYVPIGSMILASLIITIILNIFGRFFFR